MFFGGRLKHLLVLLGGERIQAPCCFAAMVMVMDLRGVNEPQTEPFGPYHDSGARARIRAWQRFKPNNHKEEKVTSLP